MKVGIWGSGNVGVATGESLKNKHSIVYYDKYKKGLQDISKIKDCEIVFVCTPTPMKSNGKIDLKIVKDSVEKINKLVKNETIIVIKSTVIPGTTGKLANKYKRLNFSFNPEFLRERCANEDAKKPDRVVIGIYKSQDKVYDKLNKMYNRVFKNIPIIRVSLKEAELVKYCSNAILAAQVSIANELFQLCKVTNVNYNKLKNILLYDKRIGTTLDVPGYDGDLGWGGRCFPKDVNALIYYSREMGYRPYLLEETWRLNLRIRKDKDWLKIEGATSNE